MRQVIGWKPSTDPKADELRNSNLNHPDDKLQTDNPDTQKITDTGGKNQNEV